MRLFNLLLGCVLFAVGAASFATTLKVEDDEPKWTFGVHTFSAHFPAHDYQHNDNFGVFGEYKGWRIGAYNNTLGKPSFYGGYHYQVGYGFGVMAGLVSGYQKKCETTVTRRTETTVDPDSRMTLQATYITTTEECFGTSRGAVTALLALSYTLPPQSYLLGAQPEVLYMPPWYKNSSVVHLALKWPIDWL